MIETVRSETESTRQRNNICIHFGRYYFGGNRRRTTSGGLQHALHVIVIQGVVGIAEVLLGPTRLHGRRIDERGRHMQTRCWPRSGPRGGARTAKGDVAIHVVKRNAKDLNREKPQQQNEPDQLSGRRKRTTSQFFQVGAISALSMHCIV